MRRASMMAAFVAAGIALAGCRQTDALVIRPYVQNVGQTEATVMWTTVRPGDFELRYGQDKDLDRVAQAWSARRVDYVVPTGEDPTVGPTLTECIHEARLTGLSPGTVYTYRVEAGGQSFSGTFRTFPDQPEPFTFVAYGDTRTDVATHRRVVQAIRQYNPAFVLHSGDLTDRGRYWEYRPQVFDPLADLIADVPLWPALGNHEGDQVAYRRLFSLPNNEKWYSFTYANAQIFALDSTAGNVNRPLMLDWLDEELASSQAEWKIVYYHHPSYDIAPRKTAWGREDVVPLLRKHKVDLVFAGHSHSYQRVRPMFTPGENDDHPVTYIVAAGGGAPLHRVERNPAAAVARSEYHFVLLTIDAAELSGRVLTPDGRQIDSFRIVKRDGKPDAEYMALAMPEGDFDKLRKLIVPHLQGITLAELPQPGRPAVPVSLSIGAGEHAMDFKLRLEGRGHYRMDPPVVTGHSSANGTTDVTVAIRARGRTGLRNAALNPVVNFILEYRIGDTDGLIYGGALRYRPDSGQEQEDAAAVDAASD